MSESTYFRRRPSTTLLAALCAVLLSLTGAASASAAIKFGAYSAAPGQPTAMEDPRVLDSFISKVGRTPDILHDYSNVTDPLLTATDIANIEAHGTTPMVTWQLFKSGWSGSAITLPDIAAGRYDSSLRDAARLARGLPFEIMIRFAHEMNGDWYPWRPGGESGNVGTNYVDAWRHIVSVFRQEGAANVKWVWSPNVDYGDYPFAQYFPGDEWVDWVALDGYNWGTGGVGVNRWQSLSEVFAPSYAKLTQMSSKPVMIAETSSSEYGGDKAAWIRKGLLATIPQEFPRVGAVVWFDRDMEQDWRVSSSDSALAAYREVASSKLYGGTVDVPVPAGDETGGTVRKGGKGGKKKTVRSLRVTRKVTSASSTDTATVSARKQKRRGHSRKRRVRGRIVYRLAEKSAVKITIERRVRRGRFTRKLVRIRSSRAGRNRVPFGRLGRGLRLKKGAYRVSLVAVGGNHRSQPRRAGFRVVKVRGRR